MCLGAVKPVRTDLQYRARKDVLAYALAYTTSFTAPSRAESPLRAQLERLGIYFQHILIHFITFPQTPRSPSRASPLIKRASNLVTSLAFVVFTLPVNFTSNNERQSILQRS
jgi:hypothetical protein